jgi:HD-like signal output (HDOD) protein
MCSAPTLPLPAITHALPDLQAWTAHFLSAPMPVLADTAELLEAYRANEDAVDAHLLSETISADPLMSLKLMAHVAAARSPRSTTDPETVTAALVMLGISPFFRAFGPQTTVDEHLDGRPEALQGLGEVLKRAQRSAAFALAFAVHRMDHDAQLIHAAAQLHDFAEMLLWLHAPALAAQIAERQRQDPALRSASIQRQLLNIELNDLQQALMRAWRLPELLVQINDERHAEASQVRNVLLAVRLARHSARGWDNAALGDDVRDIAALLNLGETPTLQLLRDIDG